MPGLVELEPSLLSKRCLFLLPLGELGLVFLGLTFDLFKYPVLFLSLRNSLIQQVLFIEKPFYPILS
jgi:hypothetical protein